MVDNLVLDEDKKHYCIRGKHVLIICAAVAVCSLVVGLGVGLSRPDPAPAPPPATGSPPEPTPTPEPSRGPCLPSADDSGPWKNFRLPDFVKPVHYDLQLEPDLDEDTYKGTVEIQLEVGKASRHLWLHIRETFVSERPRLDFLDRHGVSKPVSVKSCFEYKAQEYVVVEAQEELRPTGPGEFYVLTLDFQGWLNGSLVGFYRVLYTEDGVVKKIAATDHEPTDARKSFPCFDEPNKKATYKISIVHHADYDALSNMPLEGAPELVPGNKKRTSFQKSVPMSTYLVCFAVHQFKHVERKSARGIPLRIYTQPSQLSTAEYAADTTKVIFDYFEEYFNMNYSIQKLDKIAIPDFGTGAMENWGLITYRETNLLYDEKQSSSYNKQRVASVIAHELVHQWFGNIVTMDWWDDLWLNEGFASFFEYIGVEKAQPSWGMRDIMIISDVLPVMVDDALQSSHPIIVNVSSPAEITSVFDSISYSKGASVLRMLEDWMGKDVFRDGCRKYLKDYYFQNAKTSNFWDSLASVSGFPVAEVMDTWTQQMGYPVVDLTFMETTAKLKQSRFLLDPSAHASQPPSPLGYKWNIPIKWHSVATNKSMSDLFNMSDPEHTLRSYTSSMGKLLKINKGHIGFYRVNHDHLTWNAISQQLQLHHLVFDAADRASYIDDVFALARADKIDYGHAFNLSMYLNNEADYIAWQRVSSSIAYVRNMLSGKDALYPKFQKVFRSLVKNISSRLGWKDEGTQTDRLLREVVHSIACQMDDQDALNNASDIFNQWIGGTVSDVAVNLRLLVYRYGMKNAGDEDKWNVVLERYKKATLAQEKDKLLYGLASIQDIQLLWRLLEASKDESVVRSQDLFTLVRYVSYNPVGQSMAWDWTTLNWGYLVKRYGINDRSLGRLLRTLAINYNTHQQLWKMEHFFHLTPDAGAGVIPRQQALESVKNNIKWMGANQDEIRLWLEKNSP
ncbi:glutamyl aminopeptidase [Stigmatopora nigra]